MIEQFSEKMIVSAMEKYVSDIHISAYQNVYRIYFRYLGELVLIKTIPFLQGERVVAYFKYITNMDVGEKRKPQSGSCHKTIQKNFIELRTSTISNYKGHESLVIRLLKMKRENRQLTHFFPSELQKMYQLLERKQGLVIFSGPVDSGKTTTIHELLRQKYDEKAVQIMTLEDPVELTDERFLQTEVNVMAGVDYDDLIKASLRHHPDILMIGEIRDEKTAKMAIRASLTGHLVVATIHAKSCFGVMDRLLDLGVSYNMMKESLSGIVSMRLLPRFCYLCQSNCQIHCEHIARHHKRLLLTHILTTQQLHDFFVHGKQGVSHFNDALYKAYMCQFISENTVKEYRLYE